MNPDLIALAILALALATGVLIATLIQRADRPRPTARLPRHRPDTVHRRLPEWMPPTADARVQALSTDTQWDMPAIDDGHVQRCRAVIVEIEVTT